MADIVEYKKKENTRGIINRITEVKADGQTHKDEGEILNQVNNFYQSLYTREEVDSEATTQLLQHVTNTRTDTDTTNLEDPIWETDVKKAIKESNNNKSPGPDGLTYEFYKTFEDQLRFRLRGIEGNFHTIVLFLGTCEIQRRRPPTMTLSKAFAQTREVILTKWPGARILVTNAPPRGARNLRAQVHTTNITISKCAQKFDLQLLNIHKALCRQQKHGKMLKRDGGISDPGSPGYLCPFGAVCHQEGQEKLVLEPDITRSQQSKVCTKTIPGL